MKIPLNKSLSQSAALLLVLFVGPMAIADDTEVYTGSSASSLIRPNITFLIDTSGSMGDKILVTTVTAADGSIDANLTLNLTIPMKPRVILILTTQVNIIGQMPTIPFQTVIQLNISTLTNSDVIAQPTP